LEFRFYHLQRATVEQVLPTLLERAMGQGMRAVVVAGSEQRLLALDSHLWTYRPDSFLAHGTVADGYPADQPIWLTLTVENPNGASVLFLLDGMTIDDPLAPTGGEGKGEGAISQFTLCCDLFDGNDEEAVAAARARWKTLRDAGHDLTYWQQTDKGWEKKT
jgi:DNA polymerase-3 subunit chi